MPVLKQEDFIRINKHMNELAGKPQTNFNKDKIRSILSSASKASTPIEAAAILYYRTVREHPFRGANRRTSALAAHMILHTGNMDLSLPSIAETQSLNQRIRDGRISQEAFTELLKKELSTKHKPIKKRLVYA